MENFDKYIQLLLTKNLEEQDNELFRHRCKKRFESNGFKEKTIIFKKQKIRIKRRCYYDHKEKKYVFLLDEFLHINKNQHISETDKQCAYTMIALKKMTFSQAIKSFNDSISNSTLSRIIRKQKSNYSINFNEPTTKYKYIYIDMDDTFTTFKIKNKSFKFRNRVFHIYQDRDPKTKEFINELKMVFINECYMNSFENKNKTITQIRQILEQYYGDIKGFKLIFCGDGARYIETTAKEFGAEVALDLWHVLRKIKNIFNYKNKTKLDALFSDTKQFKKDKKDYCNNIIELIKLSKVDEAINLLIEFMNIYQFKANEINGLIFYLRRNKDAIEIWKQPYYFGTFTETYVQQLVKSYYGNFGKCYSLETFINLLRTNCIVNLIK